MNDHCAGKDVGRARRLTKDEHSIEEKCSRKSTARMSDIMAHAQETKVDVAELKGHVCDIASGGSQVDLCTKTTKGIGQCVG